MKWLAKQTHIDYAHGTTQLVRQFAWLPVYIGGVMVWLCKYEVLQMWEIKTFTIDIAGQPTAFRVGSWINLSKRIIE